MPGSGGTVVTAVQDHRVFVNRDGSALATSKTVPLGQLTGLGTQGINPGAYRTVQLKSAIRMRGGVVAADPGIGVTERGLYLVSGGVVYPTGVTPNKRYAAAIGVNGDFNARTQNRSDPADGTTHAIGIPGLPGSASRSATRSR